MSAWQARKDARRELARKLRAEGKPTNGPEWIAAKAAAGIA